MTAQPCPCPCSCGETSNHTIARRKTADGLSVVLWSDGALTAWFGSALDGVPVTRARKAESVNRQREIGWLFASWVELHDREELGDLYSACCVAVDRGISLSDAKALIRERAADAAPELKWEHTTSGDYVAHLPRMLGFASLGDVVSRSRGEFELMRVDREALFPTGWKSSSLVGLFRQMRQAVAS